MKGIKAFFRQNLGILVALVALCVLLAILPITRSSFVNSHNIFNVLRQVSTNMFIACGMTMVIILGGIDLSVGSIIAMSGGSGKIGGTIIGALIIGVLNNGLNLMNVNSFWQYIVKGCVILGAVFVDFLRNRNKKS